MSHALQYGATRTAISLSCSTRGCPSPRRSYQTFCPFCWRREELRRFWIDQNPVARLMNSGEDRDQVTCEQQDMWVFVTTASADDITRVYARYQLSDYPFESFRRLSDPPPTKSAALLYS